MTYKFHEKSDAHIPSKTYSCTALELEMNVARAVGLVTKLK